jgi:F0F1-type ATP synthase membrane subunit b/b'
MVGAGTFLNPLLKVVTTVAILAAVYFFLVRPILDTTENISGGVLNSVNQGLSQAAKAQRQAKQAEKQAQRQGAQSFEIQAGGLSLKQAQRIQRCVHDAGQDVDALQACGERANRLASQ